LLLESPGSSGKEFSGLIDASVTGRWAWRLLCITKNPVASGRFGRRYCHVVLMFIREQKLEQELFPHER
jgi:hypothetical protein